HGNFRRDGARVAGRGARTRMDSRGRHGAGLRRVPIEDRSRHPIVRVAAAPGMTGQWPGDTPRAVLSVSCRQSRDLNATATASATPLRLVSVSPTWHIPQLA